MIQKSSRRREGTGRACLRAFRAPILHFLKDPGAADAPEAWQYLEDGILLVENGRVQALGPARDLRRRLARGVPVVEAPDCLLLPGFVDCHIHFPQLETIGSCGEQLLEWLDRYVYPAEEKFKDKAHARAVARLFLKELLRNGTTAAMAFATVHPESAEALFEEAARLNVRLISGKVLMDRNAPPSLRDTPGFSYAISKQLIEKWHGRGRLLYAVTPRFAPTSSEAQLEAAGRLLSEHPGVRLHTHLAENRKEIDWVRSLFPWSGGYLDVYDRFGLLGKHSLFAHAIHLSDAERDRLAATGSSVAFCPVSNLFLGSGLFDPHKTASRGVRIGIGTDVGAGTSFSILRNLGEAYKVAQLQGQRLSPLRAFYWATLGGAEALGLEGVIGNLAPGKEADFVLWDLGATPILEYRMKQVRTLAEKLFLLMTLADDRAVRATYVAGHLAHHYK